MAPHAYNHKTQTSYFWVFTDSSIYVLINYIKQQLRIKETKKAFDLNMQRIITHSTSCRLHIIHN